MSFDPSQPANPYAAPPGGGYMAPNPAAGPDISLIIGIISLVMGIVAVPLSCCACIGIFPGGLAIILGIVSLVVPSQEGSVGKMLGIAGAILGLAPFAWFGISLAISAFNPNIGR